MKCKWAFLSTTFEGSKAEEPSTSSRKDFIEIEFSYGEFDADSNLANLCCHPPYEFVAIFNCKT